MHVIDGCWIINVANKESAFEKQKQNHSTCIEEDLHDGNKEKRGNVLCYVEADMPV